MGELTCVSWGGFNDCVSWFQHSILLSFFNHSETNTILHRPSSIEKLTLGHWTYEHVCIMCFPFMRGLHAAIHSWCKLHHWHPAQHLRSSHLSPSLWAILSSLIRGVFPIIGRTFGSTESLSRRSLDTSYLKYNTLNTTHSTVYFTFW